jgi:hypothetical protein
VLHCLWEMDRWLQNYCVEVGDEPTPSDKDSLSNEEKAATDPVVIGSREGGSETEDFDGQQNSRPWPETLSLL